MSAGTIRAMLLHRNAPIGEKPLQLTTIPCPEPGPGEILVDVSVCAICRTDLHVIEGDLPPKKLPLIPGHQVVGIVERLGPGCGRFREGDRVGIAWLRRTCGSCGYCRRGMENLCSDSLYTGYHADGGYAEKTVVPEAFAYDLPETFSDLDAAPLLCAGIIGYRALERSEPPPRGRLGLFGFGSSAHVVLQIALHRGYEVYVATRGESHRELARRMGAHWVGDSLDPMPEKLNSAIVFAPTGEIVPAALRSVDKGGVVALAGIYMTPLPEMEYESCLFHEKNLRSVEANTRADGEALLREAADIPIRPEVTTFPLERANEALIELKKDKIDGTGILLCGSG
jgi:propanol-preferring alcohol dehydrogenase